MITVKASSMVGTFWLPNSEFNWKPASSSFIYNTNKNNVLSKDVSPFSGKFSNEIKRTSSKQKLVK